MNLVSCPVETPIGTITLVARGRALTELWLPNAEVERPLGDSPVLRAAREQVLEYFAGERTVFDVPLELEGTNFQKRVWQELLAIRFGVTWSYGQLAARIGRPHASRAVGMANGRNPIAIIVPCHRVIGSDGKLTGYGGGLPAKQWLLEHERSRGSIDRPADESRPGLHGVRGPASQGLSRT